mgnify:FL=1
MSKKKQDDNKVNVSDYANIKAILLREYYDLIRIVNTLNDFRMREGSNDYLKQKKMVENRLFMIANVGGPSKNISEEVFRTIKEDFDIDSYQGKESFLEDLKELVYQLSSDMGQTGFLDTRIDKKDAAIDNSDEEIPDMFVKN